MKIATFLLVVSCAGIASAGIVEVDGTDAIFLGGRVDITIAPPGLPPPGYPLIRNATPGPFAETFPQVLSVSDGDRFQFFATGSIDYDRVGRPLILTPDGYTPFLANLNSVAGISGYLGRGGALDGLFLNDDNPQSATPPSAINFAGSGGISFTTLSPQLNQVFFIGDGLTGTDTGSAQTFIAPTGATRLFLGVTDGSSFQGNPGTYDDNLGTFIVNVTLLPEPALIGLLIAVLPIIVRGRRKAVCIIS